MHSAACDGVRCKAQASRGHKAVESKKVILMRNLSKVFAALLLGALFLRCIPSTPTVPTENVRTDSEPATPVQSTPNTLSPTDDQKNAPDTSGASAVKSPNSATTATAGKSVRKDSSDATSGANSATHEPSTGGGQAAPKSLALEVGTPGKSVNVMINVTPEGGEGKFKIEGGLTRDTQKLWVKGTLTHTGTETGWDLDATVHVPSEEYVVDPPIVNAVRELMISPSAVHLGGTSNMTSITIPLRHDVAGGKVHPIEQRIKATIPGTKDMAFTVNLMGS